MYPGFLSTGRYKKFINNLIACIFFLRLYGLDKISGVFQIMTLPPWIRYCIAFSAVCPLEGNEYPYFSVITPSQKNLRKHFFRICIDKRRKNNKNVNSPLHSRPYPSNSCV